MYDNPLILVVDDEPGIREFLSYALTMTGFRVSLAGNGQEALAALREERPAVVLTDLMMPRMSGWDLCARLRADPETATLPIVAMSAVPQQEAAADAYLAKPFDLETLVALLERSCLPRDTPSDSGRPRAVPAHQPGAVMVAR